MRASVVLTLLFAAVVLPAAFAQEECAGAVAQATSPLQAQISELQSQLSAQKATYDDTISKWQAAHAALQDEKDNAVREVAGAQATAQAEVQRVQSDLQRAQSDLKVAQAKASGSENDVAKLQAELAATQKQVGQLQGQAAAAARDVATKQQQIAKLAAELEDAKKGPTDFSGAVVALVASVQKGVVGAVEEVKAIATEAQEGKFTRLQAAAASGVSTVRGAASSAYAFVAVQLDEKLPEPFKAQVREAVAKVTALWREHVSEAQWAQPIIAKLSAANDELKSLISTQLAKSPALAPYSDPVIVQLVVYAIFGLPLLLFVVLPFALSGGSSKKADGASAKRGKGGKKGAKPGRV